MYEDMSLTMTAILRPCSLDFKICSSNVVFPEPRNPESKVTGSCLIWVPSPSDILLQPEGLFRSLVAIGVMLMTIYQVLLEYNEIKGEMHNSVLGKDSKKGKT
jgi:hypothetical protein